VLCPAAAGIVPIIASWFISPLMAALICLLFFVAVRWAVLRRQNSTNMAFYVLPFLFVFTIWVNLFFVLVGGRA
jgi:sodium-dependent phosphate transporter